MRYVPRGSIDFILSLFSPSGGQREMGWWEFLGLWWSGRGADEELYFLIFISWWSSLGGGKTCQNEALISWRESLQEVCLQINTEKKNINKRSFGRLILAWTYRDNRSCFFPVLLLSTHYRSDSIHPRDHLSVKLCGRSCDVHLDH